ncbi:L-serine dehydratase, iron-sulfur-dependent, beta subunit [Desulfotomaculum nigrificans CO-1-SRB]|uniref:L-serine deaminase n=1 Tax=Desulfotomaculum nigrificans (strain DSM 14880 / VKM B-2319 / CO-1-SRB) TaxID=868595 RepID=F6B8V5_DESCC|nr:L-serine ammonia-lyase, iron-sulfur-dependent subunit beta [Desulfotomaculum nigrificans]AEF94798.1 L-serine dehydratase, iron-sulfur-dependent, beta subunit [Desulfotomaculum nigrificans CO-1-SRB]
MRYNSIFDIIGPIMVGPSSSHTAGAARIGKTARDIFGRQPAKAEITLYGSFARTYRGHGTDIAIVGGILNLNADDENIVNSFNLAQKLGVDIQLKVVPEEPDHPNTARIKLTDEKGSLEIVGISLGGGKITITEIEGFKISLSGESPTLLVFHRDRFGAIAAVAKVLANNEINIGHMEVARKSKGDLALMVIETDQDLSVDIIGEVEQIDLVYKVALINP